jgi:molybdate transport system substrate-binding protein
MSSRRVWIFALAAFALTAIPAAAQQKSITVFAAASLKNALDDVNTAFFKQSGIKVVASYGASSALARQIEFGAPADIFLSADIDWMGWVLKAMNKETLIGLLGNRLVLVAPRDSSIGTVTLSRAFDLAGLIGNGRIAIGQVNAVPAGKYAKEALETLGIWSSVAGKIAMAEDVRAALALVARGEAVLGIVYETDAKVEPRVKVVGIIPPDSHREILYPVAAAANAKPEAALYLAFLRSAAAKAVFEQYGFTFLAHPIV